MSDTQGLSIKKIAGMIDHTLLAPGATRLEIADLCGEAKAHQIGQVCVAGANVGIAALELGGSAVGVCAVVGFPLGSNATAAKVFEARTAVADGATEIDMVMNIGMLKGRDDRSATQDIAAVVQAVAPTPVKVIIETALLTTEEKLVAVECVCDGGAAMVKTSTGFSTGGATVEDVRLLADAVNGRVSIKASGGIKDLATLLAMAKAGADRVGTSAGAEIMQEAAASARKQ